MPRNNDDERIAAALRGLRFIRDIARDHNASAAEVFDQLIVALETGGDHPLLAQWRRDRRADDVEEHGHGDADGA